MIAGAVCNSYKVEALRGVHTATDKYYIALYTFDAKLSEDTTQYTTIDEVSGAGYSAGGKQLTGMKVSLEYNTAVLTFDDPSWPNSSITARGALVYNASRGKRSVAVLDFGRDVVSRNGPFDVSFPAATEDEGMIRWR